MKEIFETDDFKILKKTEEDYFNEAFERFFKAGITVKKILVTGKSKRKISALTCSGGHYYDSDYGRIEVGIYGHK